jgi:hypothetical protein
MLPFASSNPIHRAPPNRKWALVGSRALALLFVVSTGCGDATRPTRPPIQSPSPPPPPPPPASAPAFPSLTRPGVIYLGDSSIYDAFISFYWSKIATRYVFYEDSTFGLQFSSQRWSFFEYTGRFARRDSLITFDWGGWSTAWGATGTLKGDSLTVSYNLIMQLTDFVDGVYVREPVH